MFRPGEHLFGLSGDFYVLNFSVDARVLAVRLEAVLVLVLVLGSY